MALPVFDHGRALRGTTAINISRPTLWDDEGEISGIWDGGGGAGGTGFHAVYGGGDSGQQPETVQGRGDSMKLVAPRRLPQSRPTDSAPKNPGCHPETDLCLVDFAAKVP